MWWRFDQMYLFAMQLNSAYFLRNFFFQLLLRKLTVFENLPKKVSVYNTSKKSWKTTSHSLKINQNHNVWKSAQMSHFQFLHFPPTFVLLKLTSLVILFDYKLQLFKNSSSWPFFSNSNEFLSVNVARFARSVEWDFYVTFNLGLYAAQSILFKSK